MAQSRTAKEIASKSIPGCAGMAALGASLGEYGIALAIDAHERPRCNQASHVGHLSESHDARDVVALAVRD